MKIGTTFDENVLKTNELNKTFDLLIKSGATFMEIAPDKRLIPNDLLKNLIHLRDKYNIRYHVHIPYFVDTNYDCDYFENETLLFKDFFDAVKKLETNNSMNITCHGSKYKHDKQYAIDQTYRFIDYCLNKIEREYLNCTLNIETLNHNHFPVFGESIEDFQKLFNDFPTNRLKITWDMVHAKLGSINPEAFLNELNQHVNYVHIHGLVNDKCHIALHDKDEKFKKEFTLLNEHNIAIDINVEQTVSAMKDKYLSETIKDLNYLKEFLLI